MNIEQGLQNLEYALQQGGISLDSDVYLDHVGLSRQIRSSIEEERRFAGLGPHEQLQRERTLRELDRLSLQYAGKSFTDLCFIQLINSCPQQDTSIKMPTTDTSVSLESLYQDRPVPLENQPIQLTLRFSPTSRGANITWENDVVGSVRAQLSVGG